jgi:multidrug efflux pump subunit AcrB
MNLSSEVASIPRIGGKRVNEVKAYITAGTLPHLVVTEFKQKLADSGFQLPQGYSMEYGGEAAERDEAVGNLMADIPLLIALMIATLVTSFRSFRVAFIVAVVGGLSIGLGLGSLWAFGFPFGFMGVVGTMGLVGVAVNDAIVVMAGIRDDRNARAGVPEAIADIVIRRTRHIVATSLTTIAGFIPLVLGGGGFWPPVAITIAGGVGGATILALIFVPSIYLFFIGRGAPVDLEISDFPSDGAGNSGDLSRPTGSRASSRVFPRKIRGRNPGPQSG